MNNYSEQSEIGFLSGLLPSFKFLDVSFHALCLKFPFSQFFFLIFTFCYLLLSYASQSANLIFTVGGAYEQD
mgnify:CR=1|jgi:hypothetical protein